MPKGDYRPKPESPRYEAWKQQRVVRGLETLLTNGKTARLIVPEKMSRKDFELLRAWIDLIADADDYAVDDAD